ncbi:MAG: KpsF/GutQ family sugar-phosphate isomerase [Spirochaetes bacterium]|nr:KpsF/GutQ family sugar-phosphate isomerase [Spirochaetota bacterium]
MSDDPILRRGRGVIALESKVLGDLSARLDARFTEAVGALVACRGKVVLCGMGKAGIIARKIASTLSSLGTPSFFMHPGEASHGDLGMVNSDDIVIMISNSGESDEVTALIPSVKAIGALLIAITGREKSILAREAKIHLFLGENPEACSLGLAPTSSTTAMLAMGDALAVCVMEQKPAFKEREYAFFHPGGALGKKLLKVGDLMRKGADAPVVGELTTVQEVLFAMTRARAGAAMVVDAGGRLTGFFADGDLRRHLERDASVLGQPVVSCMTRAPKTIPASAYAMEALKKMRDHRIGDLPVLDEAGKPVGMMALKDLASIGLL